MDNELAYKISLEPTGTHMLLAGEIGPNSTVLDVGCADGYMGEFLIKNKNCEVWGIEPDHKSFLLALNKGYKYIANKQVEIAAEDKILKEQKFDFILIGDVLEHLVNPSQILKILRSFLKPEGHFIVSLPNVGHYSIRYSLLFGNWDMRENGIMDKTHLHFYTLKTSRDLLENSGLWVESIRPRGDLERWFRKIGLEKLGRFIQFLLPGFFSIQFIFRARVK